MKQVLFPLLVCLSLLCAAIAPADLHSAVAMQAEAPHDFPTDIGLAPMEGAEVLAMTAISEMPPPTPNPDITPACVTMAPDYGADALMRDTPFASAAPWDTANRISLWEIPDSTGITEFQRLFAEKTGVTLVPNVIVQESLTSEGTNQEITLAGWPMHINVYFSSAPGDEDAPFQSMILHCLDTMAPYESPDYSEKYWSLVAVYNEITELLTAQYGTPNAGGMQTYKDGQVAMWDYPSARALSLDSAVVYDAALASDNTVVNLFFRNVVLTLSLVRNPSHPDEIRVGALTLAQYNDRYTAENMLYAGWTDGFKSPMGPYQAEPVRIELQF